MYKKNSFRILLGCLLIFWVAALSPISAEPGTERDITNPSDIEGQWFGFYRDTASNKFSIYDIIFYPQDKNHVIAYWKLVDENGVVFNRGVAEGDITEKGLTLFELDSNPVHYLYIRVLSKTTLLGLSQQEGEDKKVSTLGYFMVFRD